MSVATQQKMGTCHLRLMSAPPSGGGSAQFQVQYPPGTATGEQFLAPNQTVNLPINPNWGGRLEAGTILEIGAFNG